MEILAYVFGIILLASAIGHFVKPKFYSPMIPKWAPKKLVNLLVGIGELVAGVALLLPTYRKSGALGFLLLMLIFLPIHIWDLSRKKPAMGSKLAATIRLILQFVLIYLGYRLYMVN